MNFSLKVYFDQLDIYPESKIVAAIMEQYDLPGGILFNNKFIQDTEMMMLGYSGFKQIMYNIMSIDDNFLESAHTELRALLLTLKGDSSNG